MLELKAGHVEIMSLNNQRSGHSRETSSYWIAGNSAFRRKEYQEAIRLYQKAKSATPELSHLIDLGIQLAKHRLGAQVNMSDVSSEAVDIVVPVFNALDDVKACLRSLEKHTDALNVRVIVVNDGSDTTTSQWLRRFCEGSALFKLIEHTTNRGYTCAVNTGIKASTAPYVITLNSDTIVTNGWLRGLLRCMNSDPRLGIVGPLSNAASWQNIPQLRDETGSFAVNELPEGMTPDEMARLVANVSERCYPRLPFVNGFCFMIRREVIDAIGYMDEVNFPVGYGEENDYCIRAADSGFELAIADDVYVFHAKSKSFGHERRKKLSAQGTDAIKRKHSPEKYAAKTALLKQQVQKLDEIRERIRAELTKQQLHESVDLMSLRILFLLPVKGGGGGAHSVVQEVTEMRRMGIRAHVAVKHEHVDGFLNMYADIPGVQDTFVSFDDFLSLTDLAEDFDIVVGTIFSSIKMVKRIIDVYPHILPAYYVQDYEPLFFDEGSAQWLEARESYTLVRSAFLFAKTQWIIDEVKRHHGVSVHKVQPSIDHEVYKPGPRKNDGRLRVAAMIRPQTPYRGAGRTMRLLSRLYQAFGSRLEIHVFGCDSENEAFQKLERGFPFVNHGVLQRRQVSELLAQSDLFIDLSDYQAFGRTALEAMACGCAAVVPMTGGCGEYAVHGQNAVIVDTQDENACFDAVSDLLANRQYLKRLQREGLATAARYSVHAAAVSEVLALETALQVHRQKYPVPRNRRKQVFVMPNCNSQGEPLGSGYVRLVYPYQTAEILRSFRIQRVTRLPEVAPGGILLVQRHLPHVEMPIFRKWLNEWKAKGGRLIYDIDDDMLDASALRARNFPGDVDEVADRVRFLASEADLVLASTQHLANKLRAHNPHVLVIPNTIDSQLWGLDAPRNHKTGEYARSNEVVRIGYIGTPTHDADLDLITPAMKAIEAKYGSRVQIEVIGGFQNRKPTFGQRVALPRRNDYPNFVRWLQARVHWDIGIIPLVDNEFNRSKSYLKFPECAALDMALVVSDVPTYREVARHGENCLLAQSNTDDWISKLTTLIEDAALRSRLATRARLDVIEQHTTDQVARKIVEGFVGLSSYTKPSLVNDQSWLDAR